MACGRVGFWYGLVERHSPQLLLPIHRIVKLLEYRNAVELGTGRGTKEGYDDELHRAAVRQPSWAKNEGQTTSLASSLTLRW